MFFDSEIDSSDTVACCVVGFTFDFANEVQFPLLTLPDGSNVLYFVDFREVNVMPSLVLTEQEVRPILFEVRYML